MHMAAPVVAAGTGCVMHHVQLMTHALGDAPQNAHSMRGKVSLRMGCVYMTVNRPASEPTMVQQRMTGLW